MRLLTPVDVICMYRGYEWTANLTEQDVEDMDADYVECPKCGREGGQEIE